MKVNQDVRGRPLPCELYIDGYLKQNLDILYKLVSKQWDGINCTWGYEGDGKTVLEMQKNLYLNASFNLDNIVFNPEQFNEAVDNAKQYDTILWDEADILAGNWWEDILQTLISKFKRIRSKNLFVSLVTPTVFDMNRYFVIHRTRFGIEVYSKGFERGYFRFFNRERKKTMYLKGKRDWNTKIVKPNFIGRFTNLPVGFPVDMIAYNNKKDEATKELMKAQGLSKLQHLAKYRKNCLIRLKEFLDKGGIKATQEEYSNIFGTDRSNISRDFNK